MEYVLKNKRYQGKLCNKAVSSKGVTRGGEICHSEKDNLTNTLYSCREKNRNDALPVFPAICPFWQNPRFPVSCAEIIFYLLVPRFS